MYKKWLDILGASPLFKEIPPGELNGVLECIMPSIRKYDKNEKIAVSGDAFKGIGIILSGKAAVTKESAEGDRIIMTILEPGGMFGEMAAFSGMKDWPATVEAQDKCAVIFMPPEKIVGQCQRMCPSHKMLITNMLGIVSRKALLLNKKVEYLSMKTMRGKVSNLFLEQYKKTGQTTFMLPMNRNDMADFLNVSRPSLSREMCKMRDEGIIDFHMSSVRILDVENLRKMAE